VIISASRRTDIPAFYAEWFMNRVRAGFCEVPNPFHPAQVSRVSLRPEDVDAIVFWTRNPRPLFCHLAELDSKGYRYYFQYTVMDNPRLLDAQGPSLAQALRSFEALADRIGPDRAIWRYDPVVFTATTGREFHGDAFRRIAQALEGRTRRCVISLVKRYRKTEERMREISGQGFAVVPEDAPELGALLAEMADTARGKGMEIVSCAQERDLRPWGIEPGKCVDDGLIRRLFGIEVPHRRDPSQRKACGCVVSKDIGAYDTCVYGCRYCYATSSQARAQANRRRHRPDSPALIQLPGA
jgi:hypothetical protein